jgi:hypothetical protein
MVKISENKGILSNPAREARRQIFGVFMMKIN